MIETHEDEVVLWGDGSPTREFLYVDDCVEGLVLAAERYDGAEPVNLGAGEGDLDPRARRARRRGHRLRGPHRLGRRRSRAGSRAEASTPRAPGSSSASRRGRRCARGSSRPSPGTARPSPVSVASVAVAAAAGAAVRSTACSTGRAPFSARSSASRSSATVVLALAVTHNGWVYFQGGDQIWLATQGLAPRPSRAAAHRARLPLVVPADADHVGHRADVRPGAPAARASSRCSSSARSRCSASTGSQRGSAGVCSATGRRCSGSSRRSPRSRSSSTATRSAGPSSFLPQALGLTAMADFPSMVLVLAAALFVVRSLSTRPLDRRGARRASSSARRRL